MEKLLKTSTIENKSRRQRTSPRVLHKTTLLYKPFAIPALFAALVMSWKQKSRDRISHRKKKICALDGFIMFLGASGREKLPRLVRECCDKLPARDSKVASLDGVPDVLEEEVVVV